MQNVNGEQCNCTSDYVTNRYDDIIISHGEEQKRTDILVRDPAKHAFSLLCIQQVGVAICNDREKADAHIYERIIAERNADARGNTRWRAEKISLSLANEQTLTINRECVLQCIIMSRGVLLHILRQSAGRYSSQHAMN